MSLQEQLLKTLYDAGAALVGIADLQDVPQAEFPFGVSVVLPLEKHMENYAFVHRETGITQARQMFEKPQGKNRRLSVIFITEHGRREEALLGMLTPWDIMKEE